MTKLTDVTLDTVAQRAAPEVFEREFLRVLKNIQDPNTDPEEKRSITLTFEFKPLKTREEARVVLKSKVGLAATAPVGGHMFVGRADGQLRATTHDTRQEDAFESSVTPIDRNTGA